MMSESVENAKVTHTHRCRGTERAERCRRSPRAVIAALTHTIPSLLPLFTLLVLLALLLASGPAATTRAQGAALADRQRFGFTVTYGDSLARMDAAQLGAGWYVDATRPTCSLAPDGLEVAMTIGIKEGYTVNPNVLGPRVDNHPGAIWLVGNEPDRRLFQDDVTPQEYARIYHDIYAFIKGRDPTSVVSPGGIVQPTPLRLQYLDIVLSTYQTQYGTALPADLWNIHNAILNEVSCDYDPSNCWGAGIPPGITADFGEVRQISDNDNMQIFQDQIWAFRQWMADNGYGGDPLLVTEYGVLLPKELGYDTARVNTFMSNTFSFFLTATDATLGDPSDGNRLVQRWAWFSLDNPPYDVITGVGFNGGLFDYDTGQITDFGLHYASQTSSYPDLTYVDLTPGSLSTLPIPAAADPGQTVTRTVRAEVVNQGTVDSGPFTVTLAYDGPLSGAVQGTVSNVSPSVPQSIDLVLDDLDVGLYELSLTINADNDVKESTMCNNQATHRILAPSDVLYVPLVSKAGALVAASRNDAPQATVAASMELLAPQVVTGFVQFRLPTAASFPGQLVYDGQNQLVWVSERDGNKIARLDPGTGAWQEYDIPTPNSQPWDLALDGAGSVWFTEIAGNRIGRLNISSGAITEYVVPTNDSQPWGIAYGGGKVWFTEKAGDRIGTLIPGSGVITDPYQLSAGAAPTAIDVSSTFAWFTAGGLDKIGRVKISDGQVTEFQRPAGNQPQDMVLSSFGNPWFTEPGANQLVSYFFSTTGQFYTYPATSPDSEPYGVAREGDVAVWFTERAGNRLARFSGSQPIPEYTLPRANGEPLDIDIDGDGCAWYTVPGANYIERLCLPPVYEKHLPLMGKNSAFALQAGASEAR